MEYFQLQGINGNSAVDYLLFLVFYGGCAKRYPMFLARNRAISSGSIPRRAA